MSKFAFKPISETTLLLLASLFILATHNFGYYSNVLHTYASHDLLWFKLLLLSVLHGGLIFIFIGLLGFGRLFKGLLAGLLVFSASTAYFTDTYNVIIDVDMIDNTLKTDPEEVRDLLSIQQALYILLLGIAPAWLVIRMPLQVKSWGQVVVRRIVSLTVATLVTVGTLLVSADFYATYIREHANLRYYSNPLNPIYELGMYINQEYIAAGPQAFQIIAPNATSQANSSNSKPKLTIVVAGETLRADHFGLNGYQRNTTPLLTQEQATGQLLNYTNVSSCGTSTAFSLPCMFSVQPRTGFNKQQANNMENSLDILQKTGTQIVWIDNNSSSKGVADRVTYLNAKSPNTNPICTPECRDVGMLPIAEQWLDQQTPSDNKLIVLHQMGSHGPAYYKRYPQEFKQFTPICESNQLDSCSQQAIINTYDNTVLYTDYFLAESIAWLKSKSADYEVSLLYASDHGESLGEGGLYLHGYPYMLAPKAQTQVPMVYWTSQAITLEQKQRTNDQLSHDNLFHTLLGMYGVQAGVYEAGMDLFQ